jgi:hypothetical protein
MRTRPVRPLVAIVLLSMLVPATALAGLGVDRGVMSSTRDLAKGIRTAGIEFGGTVVKSSLGVVQSPALGPDDDIPGVALTGPSPIVGWLDDYSDLDDVYSVYLAAGDTFEVMLTGPSDTNFDMLLFRPGTTSVFGEDLAVSWSAEPGSSEYISYTARSSGTYYLDLWARTGAGIYTLDWAIQRVGRFEPDDTVPGVTLPPSPVVGTVDHYSDYDDVYSVYLAEGETFRVTMTGPGDTDFDLVLFPPGTTSVFDTEPVAGSAGPDSNESFDYTAATSGTHYLEVSAYAGAGTYTLDWETIPTDVTRLAGANRYEVAVNVARRLFGYWSGVSHVVIASGEDRAAADPLAASGLCWRYDAPLFLVSSTSVPYEVKAAVKEIADQNAASAPTGKIAVHIVGGPGSVPDARYDELASYVGASRLYKDRLLSTGNRFDMAVAISRRMEERSGTPWGMLVANGADATKFFDALALSPIAAHMGYPILLVQQNAVPSATAHRISEIKADNSLAQVVIGGGPATVSDSVQWSLQGVRWSGPDRYTTAIDIANHAISATWLSNSAVGVAAKLPDALTGGSMVGMQGGVLLVTNGTSLTSATGNWLASHKAQVSACYVFGGPASVTPAVIDQMQAKLE